MTMTIGELYKWTIKNNCEDKQLYKQAGNGVAINVARAIKGG